MDYIIPLIAVLLTSIIGPIAVEYFKDFIKKDDKIDTIRESLAYNVSINNKLEEILHHYQANRIWLLQFHNGGNFYPTGKSIQKFSMGYEVVGSSTNSIQSDFQNVPISLFSKQMNELLENNIISSSTTDTYKHLLGLSTKSSYQFALKSIDNKFIGIVGIDFINKKTELNSTELNYLLFEVNSIGGVLQKQLKANK